MCARQKRSRTSLWLKTFLDTPMMSVARKPSLLCALVFFQTFYVATGTGHIEVHFLYYSNTCKEFWDTNICDPMFTFCLSTPQTGGLSVDGCNYASTTESDHFQNTDRIVMEELSDIGSLANPWVVSVARFQQPKVMLVVRVRDADVFTDEHLVTMSLVLNHTVWPTKEQALWVEQIMSQEDHKLYFTARMYCDPNYYTQTCDVFCSPKYSKIGNYTCDPVTGNKICAPDKNCSTMVDFCNPNPCLNGGECSTDSSEFAYVCNCSMGWEGDVCENRTNPCFSQPCLNNGSCSNSQNGSDYSCTCMLPFSGDNCELEELKLPDTTSTSTHTMATSDMTRFEPAEESTNAIMTNTATSPSTHTTMMSGRTRFKPFEASTHDTMINTAMITSTHTTVASDMTRSEPAEASTNAIMTKDMNTRTHAMVMSDTNKLELSEESTNAGMTNKDHQDLEKDKSTTEQISAENVGLVSEEEDKDYFQMWYLAIIFAVLLIVYIVALFVIIRRRRRNSKQLESPALSSSVFFNGSRVSIENGIYSHVDKNKSETERQLQEGLPPTPVLASNPTDEELLSQSKPKYPANVGEPAAMGNNPENNSDLNKKKSGSTDLPAGSERALSNLYSDLALLQHGQTSLEKSGDQKEHHYQDVNEVADSMPTSTEADENSDITFNIDPDVPLVVTVQQTSSYDTPSNNASLYSTPPSHASTPWQQPANSEVSTFLRSSEEI